MTARKFIRALRCFFFGHRLNKLDRVYPRDFFEQSYLRGKVSYKCTRCKKYIRGKM